VRINPYVSRGGFKLAHALNKFGIDSKGKTAVDIGASTGGFTDCLLQQGAKKVYAVDVGYGQLEGALRNDSRVTAIDRQNARHITPEIIGEFVDLVVIDVSFISLKLILPSAIELLKPDGKIIALVKPQFEVGKSAVENKGIIKDPQKHLNVLLVLRDFIHDHGWALKNLTSSPIQGREGNKEFLVYVVKHTQITLINDQYLFRTAFG
tara:strand:- start:423 stop:1046 length:624 start_codon:yes stop_codon:yes gene_type:complete